MSRKYHRPDCNELPNIIQRYADSRGFDFHQYSEYHFRLIDSQYTVFDFWPTTGKYYIKETNYVHIQQGIIERGGETGILPFKSVNIFKFLDKLFFAADVAEKYMELTNEKV